MSVSENIVNVNFKDALGERYLAYAMSTIVSRSLPDVRDGLKPVHRRLLYAMLQLKLDPKSGFKKCARVVGDVIGKYHPHGDVAVYDALVRLAQEFAVRYPLVDGQGNFGSIDGDNAAAMRYTEARLTEVALSIIQDINSDTVDFKPNYDGSEEEPVVMPSHFPNLLANGSEGIAVGMATSVPPHNLEELCDALLLLIQEPDMSTEKLIEIIPGPDFPTGGILAENKENIIKSYETGRGSFRLRSRWEKEELSRGLYQIVITEIPYQVQKSRLIEKIAELFKAKRLPLISNIRDESDEKVRIVIDPKSRITSPELIMESLYRVSELEIKVQLNLNVIRNGAPEVISLKQALLDFLSHRQEIVLRRSRNRIGQIDHRLEILAGLLITYLNLDEVIRIIREEDDPKNVMMQKWQLSDIQVEAILNMRLRSLRKLEEMEIRREHEDLIGERAGLQEIIDNDVKRWQVIADEIQIIKKKFGKNTTLGARRTDFTDAPTNQPLDVEAFIEKEPLTILCSKKNWLRALKGHGEDLSAVKYKEGDKCKYIIKAYTTDKLLIFTSDGKFFTINCNNISGGKGFGEPLNLLVDMDQNSEIADIIIYDKNDRIIVASDKGKGFVVSSEDLVAQTRTGKQILNLSENAKALVCKKIKGDHVAVMGQNRKLLIFKLTDLPVMKRGSGVMLQRYKVGGLSDIASFNLEEGLSWKLGDRMRLETNLSAWIGSRASAGKLPPPGFPRNNKFS